MQRLGWLLSYYSRLQTSPNRKRPLETRPCPFSFSQDTLTSFWGSFPFPLIFRLTKILQNFSNSKSNCGYRNILISAIADSHVLQCKQAVSGYQVLYFHSSVCASQRLSSMRATAGKEALLGASLSYVVGSWSASDRVRAKM